MKNLPGPAVRRVGLLTLALLASTVLAASAAHAQQRAVYRDAAAPIEQRVEDLLARMTLDEKIVQLTAIWTQKNQLFDRNGQFDPAAARLRSRGVRPRTARAGRRYQRTSPSPRAMGERRATRK